MLSNNLVALSHSLVNVGFSNSNFLLILGLVLSKLGSLKVGLDGQPQLPPQPGLTNVVVPNGALEAIEGQLLVLHLLEHQPGSFSSCLRLQPGQNGSNPVLTDFLHVTQVTSTEEDLCMSKPVLLRLSLDSIQYTLGSSLVILSLGNNSSSKNVVPHLELCENKLMIILVMI